MDLFFDPGFDSINSQLSKEESHHCTRVLRNSIGDSIGITNGQGKIWQGLLADISSGICKVEVIQELQYPAPSYRLAVAISPTKSSDRLEWFVEKSTEMGVTDIYAVSAMRTERKKVNDSRLHKKAISAVKQSQNPFLPIIHPMTSYSEFIGQCAEFENRFIASQHGIVRTDTLKGSRIILIGPEGGFTDEELNLAIENGFKDVTLGNHILRTETAGVIGLSFLLNS